jgi:hypothetical protein
MAEKLGRCYWLPSAIALTSTANEIITGVTPEAKADISIVAALTDLTVSRFKVRDLSGQLTLTNEYLPILSMFGKRGGPRPAYYYPTPIPLDFRNRLDTEVKNAASGPEAAGHVVYLGVPREPAQAELTLEGRGYPSGFFVNANFTGTANEIVSVTSPELDKDFVITGAITDLQSAQVRIQGVRAEAWMTDFTPVWALAGRRTDDIPAFLWPRKYLIPRNGTITIDFKNVGSEAAGLGIYFVGQKLNA